MQKYFALVVISILSTQAFSQRSVDSMIRTEKNFANTSLVVSTREAFIKFIDSAGIVFEKGKPVNGLDLYTKSERRPGILTWEPEYAEIAKTTNTFRSHGGINPYDLIRQHPELTNNHFALIGAYAQSVIAHHPGEFLAKSVPVLFSSLDYFYYESEVDPHGLLARPLFGMDFVFHVLYKLNLGFPLVAAAWIFLLCWRRTTRLLSVQAMGILLLVVLYGIVMTTLGGYSSYIRFHTPFNPLLMVILWGGVLAGLLLILRPGSSESAPEVSTETKEFVGRT